MELPELARELLLGKNYAAIATSMKDGAPSASIVWCDTDGEHVIFNTAEGRLKPNSLRRDARVAVAVFDMENPYRQAMIRGRVVSMEHEGANEHSDRMAKKYLGVDDNPHRYPHETRIIVRIKPDHVGLMP